jgi:hypothetical protein
VLEKRVLRRIFSPKREKNCIISFTTLHFSTFIRVIKSRRIRWAGHVTCMAEINAYKILVEKLEGKRPLKRPRHGWKCNIRTDLREIG